MKECKKCKRELPMDTDHYFKKINEKDGFQKNCKECMGNRFSKHLSVQDGYKFCKKCDRELSANNRFFTVDAQCKDGLRNVCRECSKDGHFMDERYIPKKWWTKEEDVFFTTVYKNYTNEELIKIYYPDCSTKDLSDKAFRLGILGKTDEVKIRANKQRSEKTSGKNSYMYGKLMSEDRKKKLSIAKKGVKLGKNKILNNKKMTQSFKDNVGIRVKSYGKWKGSNNPRHLNPLNGSENGRWQGGISELYTHLRRNLTQWKLDSVKNCEYKCALSGSKFDDIHHLYSFHNIIEETLDEVDLEVKSHIGEYSDEELTLLTNKCLEIHYRYPLGVCLKVEIHNLFHDLYGYFNNTEYQFNEFKERYIAGEFKEVS